MKRYLSKSTNPQNSSRDTRPGILQEPRHFYLSGTHVLDIIRVPPRPLLTSHFFFTIFSLRSTGRHGTMRYPRAWFALVANGSFQHLHFPICRVLGRFDRPLSRAPRGLGRCNSPAPHANNSFTTKSPNVCLVIGSPTLKKIRFPSLPYIEPWKTSRYQDMKRRANAK